MLIHICDNCGAKYAPEEEFCPFCGALKKGGDTEETEPLSDEEQPENDIPFADTTKEDDGVFVYAPRSVPDDADCIPEPVFSEPEEIVPTDKELSEEAPIDFSDSRVPHDRLTGNASGNVPFAADPAETEKPGGFPAADPSFMKDPPAAPIPHPNTPAASSVIRDTVCLLASFILPLSAWFTLSKCSPADSAVFLSFSALAVVFAVCSMKLEAPSTFDLITVPLSVAALCASAYLSSVAGKLFSESVFTAVLIAIQTLISFSVPLIRRSPYADYVPIFLYSSCAIAVMSLVPFFTLTLADTQFIVILYMLLVFIILLAADVYEDFGVPMLILTLTPAAGAFITLFVLKDYGISDTVRTVINAACCFLPSAVLYILTGMTSLFRTRCQKAGTVLAALIVCQFLSLFTALLLTEASVSVRLNAGNIFKVTENYLVFMGIALADCAVIAICSKLFRKKII